MTKPLFLHVPKTSGISLKRFFKGAIEGFYIQADSRDKLTRQDPLIGRVRNLADIQRVLSLHGGLALHVDSGDGTLRRSVDFRSLAPVLFDPANVPYFRQFTILTMWREPLSRFMSEYTSVAQRQKKDPAFLPDLDMSSVQSHLERMNANPLVHFLLEEQFDATRQFSGEDLARIKRCILDYPIHIGIYERYDESIDYFSRVLGRAFTTTDIPRLNVTGEAPPHVPPAAAEAFATKNRLDIELYDFAAGLFDTRARHGDLVPSGR